MPNIKELIKNKAFVSFSMGFVFFLLVFLPDLIINKGIIYGSGDYNMISVPFIYHIRGSILEGKELIWDWSSGLGNQFLSQYAYYNLFSPFSALYLLVPERLLSYSVPYITALKFGTGSMLGYFYIKRYISNNHYAVIGGFIYAFSSFTGYSLPFSFLDVFMLFPLLLISLDELCINNGRGVFALSAALMALVNYYFFFGQAVFCIIYYFVRCTDKDYGGIKRFFSVAFEAVLGCGIAAVVILPVLNSLFEVSARAESLIAPENMFFYNDIFRYLKIMQSAFMVPDPFAYVSLFPEYERTYPFGTLEAFVALYIPLFSAAGVISYVVKKRKTWQTYLIAICAVMALVPVLNQLFSMLNSAYYARWFYMPVLIGVLVSVKALEEKISFKPGITVCCSAVALLLIYQLIADTDEIGRKSAGMATYSIVQNAIHFAITVISLVMLIIIVKSKRDKEFVPKLYIFAVAGCYMTFGIMSNYFLTGAGKSDKSVYISAWNINEELPPEIDVNQRISANFGVRNYNLIWGMDSPNYYNSMYNAGHLIFMEACGFSANTDTLKDIVADYDELNDLLSVKYFIVSKDNLHEERNVTPLTAFGAYNVYENNNYIPMGFTYDTMISADCYKQIENIEHKHRIYMKSLVVENTEEFEDILISDNENAMTEISDDEYSMLVERHRSEACYDLVKNNDGLTAKINLSRENIVFFSTSYNSGWKAYVDGEETAVHMVNNGMVGIRVPEGEHEISLVYTVVGLKTGLIISCTSAAVLVIYIIICKRKGKKNVG